MTDTEVTVRDGLATGFVTMEALDWPVATEDHPLVTPTVESPARLPYVEVEEVGDVWLGRPSLHELELDLVLRLLLVRLEVCLEARSELSPAVKSIEDVPLILAELPWSGGLDLVAVDYDSHGLPLDRSGASASRASADWRTRSHEW